MLMKKLRFQKKFNLLELSVFLVPIAFGFVLFFSGGTGNPENAGKEKSLIYITPLLIILLARRLFLFMKSFEVIDIDLDKKIIHVNNHKDIELRPNDLVVIKRYPRGYYSIYFNNILTRAVYKNISSLDINQLNVSWLRYEE